MFLLQANTTSLINVADLQLIAPELILTACACVALVMEVILPYRKSKLTAYFSLIGVALAFVSLGCSGGPCARRCRSTVSTAWSASMGSRFSSKRFSRRRSSSHRHFNALSRYRRRTTWRVLRTRAVCDRRHDVPCLRLRSHHALHQSRTDGVDVLRAGRVHQAREKDRTKRR